MTRKIPINSWQRSLDTLTNAVAAPQGRQRSWGILLKVWEGHAIKATDELPPDLKMLRLRYPGVLFTSVLCLNPLLYLTLPWEGSEATFYSVHGNAAAVEPSLCYVYYTNNDVSSGSVDIAFVREDDVPLEEEAENATIGPLG